MQARVINSQVYYYHRTFGSTLQTIERLREIGCGVNVSFSFTKVVVDVLQVKCNMDIKKIFAVSNVRVHRSVHRKAVWL